MRYQDIFSQPDLYDDNSGLSGISSYQDMMNYGAGPYSPGPMGGNVNPQPIVDTVGDLYHFNPSYAYRDKLNALMGQMPMQDQYKPSKLRRIGAALASLSGFAPAGMTSSGPLGLRYNAGEGINAREDILNAPYRDAIEQWKMQIPGATKLADLEAEDNRNSRILANEMEGRRIEQERLKEAARKTDIGNENTDAAREQQYLLKTRELEQKQQKIDKYSEWLNWKMEHPDYHSATVDGKLVMYNEKTGDVKETGLEGLSDREKINLKVEGDLREIQARTKGALAVGAQRIQGAKDLEETRYPAGRPVTRSATKDLTPGQVKQAIINRANEVKAAHPEWADYIDIDQKGNVGITPPSTHWYKSGPDQDTYNKINSEIYGDEKNTGTKTNPPKAGTQTETGTIRMRAPNGKVGPVKKENVAKAKKDGYVEVP